MVTDIRRNRPGAHSFFVLGKILVVLILISSANLELKAQDRCGTVSYTKLQLEKNLIREDETKFEQWLSLRRQKLEMRVNAAAIFKIPVVVHVIHNGESIGSGTNISDEQILSQLRVLNNDFNRVNADTSKTPSEFLSLAGRINIEFVLAKQSPDGNVTSGIVRVKGTRSQWTLDDNAALKRLSYWPAEDYLNIWVTDIASTILGYAQFPVSDLPGLEDPEGNRLTDGVVLDYRIVGSSQDGSFNLTNNFNRGRTATHEVGHFLGLRHIWGDDEGKCGGNGDYVDDTPDQGNSSSGCPSHPQVSCNVQAMFQNYMDYTNDLCMNLYTKQQVERMLTVLENSPRRASLLTSHGLYEPVLADDDLALVSINSPSSYECSGELLPSVVVRNKGANDVFSAKIQFSIGSEVRETKEISFGSLPTNVEAEVFFSVVSLPAGTTDFRFEILQTNSRSDGESSDNFMVVETQVPDQQQTPFSEAFNNLPASWTLINEGGDLTWSVAQTGAIGNSANSALVMQYFSSDNEIGEKDIAVTPVIDLREATSPFLAFDVAYAQYQNRADVLEVHLILDCNIDISAETAIYSKGGNELSTASSFNGSFTPNESQWRREVINLQDYIGKGRVQIAFVGISDNGNNIFVDNVAVRTEVSENVAIKEVTNPSPVHCYNEVLPTLLVENRGDVPIHSLKVIYSSNNNSTQTKFVNDQFVLAPGEETLVNLAAVEFVDGVNTLWFEVIEPNGFMDIDLTDNAVRVNTVVSHSEDKIPLRKNFDEGKEETWQIVSPSGNKNWQATATNYDRSLFFPGDSTRLSDTVHFSWFVSPSLDLSHTTTASLFFDLSHSARGIDSSKDLSGTAFQVLASRDCGATFDEVLFSSNEMLTAESLKQVANVPVSESDWTRYYINLNGFAGVSGARIAFVVSSAIQDDIYLDNIEFFLSDDPSPAIISDLYSLYPNKIKHEKSFYVTFNLPDRQSVAYELVDITGRQVGARELTDVLNQTYKIDVDLASSGVYLVRLLIDQRYYVSRIVVY